MVTTLQEDKELEQDTADAVNYDMLELSDEDFLKLEDEPQKEVIPVEPKEEEEDKKEKEEDLPDDKEIEPIVATEEPAEETESVEVEEVPVKKAVETDTVEDTKKEEKVPEDDKEVPETVIDYKAEYDKVMAPFKANGTQMQMKSAEDAVTLMQMGANYHKKMAGLKPSLKLLKVLEKNDLLDVDQLSYLIDLKNKNPEAITKLVKDSGLDPLDINVKDDSAYTPTTQVVNDTEIELDTVLDNIKQSPTYAQTLNVITKDWDDASRTVIASKPQIISIINDHVADGTFDKVMGVVTYERSLGKLQGVSDFDAYRKVGDALHAAGKLGAPPKAVVIEPTQTIVKEPTPEEIKRKERKKAASPTKTVGTPVKESYNPLTMSDEDFEKFDPKKFKV